MKKFRNRFYLLLSVFISLVTFSTAYGIDSLPSAAGGGAGLVLSEELDSKIELRIAKDLSSQIPISASSVPIISASQLVGLYSLENFIVYYDSGGVLDSSDYQVVGDMVLTSNDTAWQRMAISGFQTLVASGSFSISNEIMTIYNDLTPVNSVLNLSWDGTYLTTEGRFTNVADPFTEIDKWKRVLSSSDQDNDGVLDEWDDCPSTPLNSCVDNKGCPSSSSTNKTIVIPMF